MRDPFSWSLPLGRIFGITIRVHLLFLVFVLAMWLRAATSKDFPPGAGLAMLVLMGLTFLSVLLHELGHCYAARSVEGDATEVLLWPLGGLARCDVPNTPSANFLTALGGPAVNFLLFTVTGLVLVFNSLLPPFNPLPSNAFNTIMTNWATGEYYGSQFAPIEVNGKAVHQLEYWQFLLGQFFWINWFLFLLNLLPGIPLDGGRMLQAALWPRTGFRQATLTAIFIGFIVMLVIGILSLVINEILWLCLAVFIYASCKQEWIMLETGAEESLFGYDFSQGYTSLEQNETPRPKRKKRLNPFQRWLQRRAQRKMQREMERAVEEERRMDELLAKIQSGGVESLTEEERRFLKRVSDRYRNRP
jgi:Zn-dependent protease